MAAFRSVVRSVVVFAFLLIILPAGVRAETRPATTQAADKAFFFTATADKKTIYCLGSLHAGRKDFYPLPKEIEDAFNKSSALLVEADILNRPDQVAVRALVADKGFYTSGDTLSKHLDADTNAALRAFCKAHKVPAADLEPMRPWRAGLTLSVACVEEVGADMQLGLDLHFLKQAAKDKKKIVELESVTKQVRLLADMPDEQQLSWFKQTLQESGDLKGEFDRMYRAWRDGDIKAMSELMFTGMLEDPQLRRTLLDDRNVTMEKGIRVALVDSDTLFVVVGAGHLVGDKGVLKLLEKKGYAVTQPAVTRAKAPATTGTK